ncbi:MAG: hypothetical protein ABIA63_12995, partial [bacterium]
SYSFDSYTENNKTQSEVRDLFIETVDFDKRAFTHPKMYDILLKDQGLITDDVPEIDFWGNSRATTGNVTIGAVEFQPDLDITPPIITITGVENNHFYGPLDIPIMSVVVFDEEGGMTFDNLTIQLNSQPAPIGGIEVLGNITVYLAPIEAENQYVLEVNAVDWSGNKSSATLQFYIDLTPPQIFANPPSGAYSQVQLLGDGINLIGTDNPAFSGIDKILWRVAPSTEFIEETSAEMTLLGLEFPAIIEYKAIDLAGNESELGSSSYELLPPVTLYVDDSYTGGDADGSVVKPFPTISQAFAQLPGMWIEFDNAYIIKLFPGTYMESYVLQKAYCSPYGNITIESYYTEPESMAVWQATPDDICLTLPYTDYLVLNRIKFAPNGNTGRLIWARNITKPTIKNCFFLGKEGNNAAYYGIASSSTGGCPDYLSIENCVFYRIQDYGIWFNSAYTGVKYNNRIINNTFYRCGNGVYLAGANQTNRIDGPTTLIANNIIDGSNTALYLKNIDNDAYMVYNNLFNDYSVLEGSGNSIIVWQDNIDSQDPLYAFTDSTKYWKAGFLMPTQETVTTGGFVSEDIPALDFRNFERGDEITIGAVEFQPDLDIEPPAISIVNVLNEELYNAQEVPRNVDVTVTDNQGISLNNINILLNGNAAQIDNTFEISAQEILFELSPIDAQGSHNLTVNAEDDAGNTNQEVVLFNIDITPPVVTISPLPGMYEQSELENLVITLSATDEPEFGGVESISWLVESGANNASGVINSAEGTVSFSELGIPIISPVTVTYSATDIAGNQSAEQTAVYETVVPDLPAETLFVDDSYVGGGNDGSLNAPFNTINEAVQALPDTPDTNYAIAIFPGTYSERVDLGNPDRQWYAAKSLTIKSRYDVPDSMPLWTTTNAWACLFIENEDHITVEGIKFTGNVDEPNPIWLRNNVDYVTIRRCYFLAEGDNKITNGVNIQLQSGNEGSDYITIENCIFWGTSGYGIYNNPYNPYTHTGLKYINNTFYRCSYAFGAQDGNCNSGDDFLYANNLIISPTSGYAVYSPGNSLMKFHNCLFYDIAVRVVRYGTERAEFIDTLLERDPGLVSTDSTLWQNSDFLKPTLDAVKTGGLISDLIPEDDFFGILRGSIVTIGAVEGD